MAKKMPGRESGGIAYVELHDSRVEQITLFGGGKGLIRFEHISVYHQVKADHFEIWSYEAELEMEDIQACSLTGSILEDDYVSDGRILDASLEELNLSGLLRREPADQIRLVFGSGSTLSLLLGWVCLRLIKSKGKIEDWNGPL